MNPISSKKLLFVVSSLIILVFAAACAPAPSAVPTTAPTTAPQATAGPKPTSPPTNTPAPKSAGELRFALDTLGTGSLDPIKNGSTARFFLALMYDNVVGLDSSAHVNFNNGLAEKWDVSPDGKTHTVTLRKGVKFHNGDEVTAEDVKFSWERYARPESMVGGSSWKNLLGQVDTPDAYTLVIKTASPTYMFPYEASAGALGFILPKKYMMEKGEDYFLKNPIGSGPYKFVEQVAGSSIKFEVNEKYWRMVPKWKAITFLLVPEEATRMTMLKRGEADIVSMSLDRVKDVKEMGLKLIQKPGEGLVGVMLLEQYRPDSATNDKRIRQALSLAINREELIKGFFDGYATPARSFPQASYAFGYDKEWQPKFDLDAAKQLLQQAGYPNSFKNPEITVERVPSTRVPNNPMIADVVAAQWQKAGFKVKTLPLDLAVWRDMLTKQTHGPSVATIYAQDNSAGPDMGKIKFVFHSKGVGHWVGNTMPELDKLIDAADAAKTEAERDQAMLKVSRYANENNISIPMLEVDTVFGSRGEQWDMGKISNDMAIWLVAAK